MLIVLANLKKTTVQLIESLIYETLEPFKNYSNRLTS